MPLRLPTPSGLFVEGEQAITAQAVGLTEEQKKGLLRLYHALMSMHGFLFNVTNSATIVQLWNALAMTGIEYSGDAHLSSCYWHGCPRPIDGTTRGNPGLRPGEAAVRSAARRAAAAPVQPEPPEEDEEDEEEYDDTCRDPECDALACVRRRERER